MTAQAVGYARACFDEALDWARQRHTFGAALSGRQVIRHKLMDMLRAIDVARCHLYDLAFKRGTKSERICREVKVMMIGGGSEEIMKDLAARQLGV
jgi:acyl-CoA dehydrogenase